MLDALVDVAQPIFHQQPVIGVMKGNNSSSLPKQYQHYVPQFILKNFSVVHHVQDRRTGRTRKGEAMVNRVDLSAECVKIQETPVRHILGKHDMYDNVTKSSQERRRIELKLSHLESDASLIFRRILRAYDDKHKGLWLTREEKNLMRRFLFVMKYRGPTFYERYCHDTIDTYVCEDKAELAEYMKEKGYSRPIDVWLDNLATLMDFEMDEGMKWLSELPKLMYSHDAKWAIMHCQLMYMTICTPSEAQDEFIMTDNCYHVSEGPFNVSTNLLTGKTNVKEWLNLHEFAPVSPKLMIVLRSFLFPVPLEENSDPNNKLREKFRSMVEKIFGSISKTVLATLPVAKARNNYSQIVNGALHLDPNQDGTLKQSHSFFFHLFQIDSAHVNKINGVFLENSELCENILFHSRDTLRGLLEWYLSDRDIFQKRVTASPEDTNRMRLIKLGKVLNILGSEVEPYMEVIPFPVLTNDETVSLYLDELRKALPHLIPDDEPSGFMQIYLSLGGCKSALSYDIDQADRMLKLRIKIDVWSHGLGEALRQTIRDRLLDVYQQLPRRRFWLFLKKHRFMEFPNEGGENDAYLNEPEDAVARANAVISSKTLNKMMYWAAGSDTFKRRHPGFDPCASMIPNASDPEQRERARWFIFQRSIITCGIEAIEAMAIASLPLARETANREAEGRSLLRLSTQELTELYMRVLVNQRFQAVLEENLPKDVLEGLRAVFFNLLYVIPFSFD